MPKCMSIEDYLVLNCPEDGVLSVPVFLCYVGAAMLLISLMIKRHFVYSVMPMPIGWRPVILATRRPVPINDQQNMCFD